MSYLQPTGSYHPSAGWAELPGLTKVTLIGAAIVAAIVIVNIIRERK